MGYSQLNTCVALREFQCSDDVCGSGVVKPEVVARTPSIISEWRRCVRHGILCSVPHTISKSSLWNSCEVIQKIVDLIVNQVRK
jgi:hypothetical protein